MNVCEIANYYLKYQINSNLKQDYFLILFHRQEYFNPMNKGLAEISKRKHRFTSIHHFGFY